MCAIFGLSSELHDAAQKLYQQASQLADQGVGRREICPYGGGSTLEFQLDGRKVVVASVGFSPVLYTRQVCIWDGEKLVFCAVYTEKSGAQTLELRTNELHSALARVA